MKNGRPPLEVVAIDLNTKYKSVVQHSRVNLSNEAHFAMDLIKLGAMMATQPDGEDAAGHQKMRLLTPEELVNRSIEIAGIAFETFEKMKWAVETPPWSDLVEDGEANAGFRG